MRNLEKFGLRFLRYARGQTNPQTDTLGTVLCNRSRSNDHMRHIRSLLTLDAAKAMAVSIVGCRLDYCNSVLYGWRRGVVISGVRQ